MYKYLLILPKKKGDTIQSIGVIIAAIIIYVWSRPDNKVKLADPICTFVFAILVMFTTV